jgi:hypothetical protein
MPRRLVAPLALMLAALAAACGGQDAPPPDPACTASPGAIVQALARAPRPVTLGDGARLSECVSRSRNDAELQETGRVLTRVADELALRAQRGDLAAATALGYLVGAARRGAARTAGVHAELQRRMERSAAFLAEGGPRSSAALRRGLRAGTAKG